MILLRTIFVSALFSSGVSQSSAYSTFANYPSFDPNKCGGYCIGGSNPCFNHLYNGNKEICEWAHDHCCPPAGDGSQWTTTTTTTTLPPDPNICGGFCATGKTWPGCWGRTRAQCEWALRECCPPNGDGSQWTTTEKAKEELPVWAIPVIVASAFCLVCCLVFTGLFCFRYHMIKTRTRRVNPGGDPTLSNAYPGTGAQPGLYQPVIQPQAHYPNNSEFYA